MKFPNFLGIWTTKTGNFLYNDGEVKYTSSSKYEDRLPGKTQYCYQYILTDLASSQIYWEQSMEVAIYSLRQTVHVFSHQSVIESRCLTW